MTLYCVLNNNVHLDKKKKKKNRLPISFFASPSKGSEVDGKSFRKVFSLTHTDTVIKLGGDE